MAGVSQGPGGTTFDFSVEPPLKEFNFRLSRFVDSVNDFSSCLRACGELFKRQMVEVFSTEGAAGGGKWKPLTPTYAAWKAEHFPGRPIGVCTSALRNSMIGGGGYTEKISQFQGEFGMSDNSLAAPYGKHFAKLRPVLRLKAKHGREYQKIVHTWLVTEMNAAMGSSAAGGAVASAVRQGGVTSKSALSAVL